MKILKMLSLILLVALFVASCDSGDTATEVEPTRQPTVIIPPIEEEPLVIADINSDYSAYNTYTLEINLTVTNGNSNEITQFVDMQMQISNDPPVQQLSMTAQGVDASLGSEQIMIDMVTVDGQTYMDMGDIGCVTLPSSGLDGTPFANLLEADTFFDGLNNADRVLPNAMVNGIEAAHYTFDETFFDEVFSGDTVQGHLWLEVDTNRLVRLEMHGEGAGLLGGIADDSAENDTLDQFRMTYDVTQINQPFETIIPETCDEDAADEGNQYPLLDDAYEQASFSGVLTYKSATTIENAVTFYQEALQPEGWVYNESESLITNAVATLIFSRDDVTITLLISPDPVGEDMTITIMDQ